MTRDRGYPDWLVLSARLLRSGYHSAGCVWLVAMCSLLLGVVIFVTSTQRIHTSHTTRYYILHPANTYIPHTKILYSPHSEYIYPTHQDIIFSTQRIHISLATRLLGLPFTLLQRGYESTRGIPIVTRLLGLPSTLLQRGYESTRGIPIVTRPLGPTVHPSPARLWVYARYPYSDAASWAYRPPFSSEAMSLREVSLVSPPLPRTSQFVYSRWRNMTIYIRRYYF